jgi:hypothetical protein
VPPPLIGALCIAGLTVNAVSAFRAVEIPVVEWKDLFTKTAHPFPIRNVINAVRSVDTEVGALAATFLTRRCETIARLFGWIEVLARCLKDTLAL